MVDYQKPEDEVEAGWNFLNLIQGIEDTLVLILKAHLLLEEIMQIAIERAVKNPSAIRPLNFECSKKIALAEALYGDTIPTWVWSATRQLNRIRNDLAHNVEPKGLDERIDSFCQFVKRESGQSFADAEDKYILNEVLGLIGLEAAMLLGRSDPYLAALDGSYIERRREEGD